jgi:hypothetical protein
MLSSNAFVIRRATEADRPALRRLAELDSQRPIREPVLIGELGGEPAAAISLADGRVVANPFEHTALLVSHVRMRAAGTTAHARTPSLADRIRAAMRPWTLVAPRHS